MYLPIFLGRSEQFHCQKRRCQFEGCIIGDHGAASDLGLEFSRNTILTYCCNLPLRYQPEIKSSTTTTTDSAATTREYHTSLLSDVCERAFFNSTDRCRPVQLCPYGVDLCHCKLYLECLITFTSIFFPFSSWCSTVFRPVGISVINCVQRRLIPFSPPHKPGNQLQIVVDASHSGLCRYLRRIWMECQVMVESKSQSFDTF